MKSREWLKHVRKLAKAYGYTVERSKNNHIRLVKPGFRTVHTSATPSDHRVLMNTRAQLRRSAANPLSKKESE